MRAQCLRVRNAFACAMRPRGTPVPTAVVDPARRLPFVGSLTSSSSNFRINAHPDSHFTHASGDVPESDASHGAVEARPRHQHRLEGPRPHARRRSATVGHWRWPRPDSRRIACICKAGPGDGDDAVESPARATGHRASHACHSSRQHGPEERTEECTELRCGALGPAWLDARLRPTLTPHRAGRPVPHSERHRRGLHILCHSVLAGANRVRLGRGGVPAVPASLVA